jgi:hypothetical protein
MNFPPKNKTMTLNITEAEMDCLEELSTRKDTSKTAIMRQALRLYQMVDLRLCRGETMHFSGDKDVQMLFVGDLGQIGNQGEKE